MQTSLGQFFIVRHDPVLGPRCHDDAFEDRVRYVYKQKDPTADWVREDRHKARFHKWVQRVGNFLAADYGRGSDLARHLGVSRQRVSTWFTLHFRQLPGWAVAPTMDYLCKANAEELMGFTLDRPPQVRVIERQAPKPRHQLTFEDWREM